jgi:hypothetical protein
MGFGQPAVTGIPDPSVSTPSYVPAAQVLGKFLFSWTNCFITILV